MYKIKIYGIGGQGVVTASKLICTSLCIYEDKYAKTIPAYGHERRGAPVFSDVIIDDKPILLSTFVYEPDIVIVLDPFIVNKGVDIGKGIHAESILVINTEDGLRFDSHGFKHIYYIGASKLSLSKLGRDLPNIPILGALARAGITELACLCDGVEDYFSGNSNYRELVVAGYEGTTRI